MKIKIFLIVAGVLVFIGFIASISGNYRMVIINKKIFISRLAITTEEQKKGLAERPNICRYCAMLFDFKNYSQRSFWMKGMEFDLDIIWINNGKIVYIKRNFSHNSHETVSPSVLADKVLEVRAGLSEKYDFKIGDDVKIY